MPKAEEKKKINEEAKVTRRKDKRNVENSYKKLLLYEFVFSNVYVLERNRAHPWTSNLLVKIVKIF